MCNCCVNLKKKKQLPRLIIYRPGITADGAQLAASAEQHYYPLFNLAKALMQEKIQEEIQLLCVGPTGSLLSEAFFGFVRTLQKERPTIIGRVAEIDHVEDILQAMQDPALVVRYDKAHVRWIKTYQETTPNRDHIAHH